MQNAVSTSESVSNTEKHFFVACFSNMLETKADCM